MVKYRASGVRNDLAGSAYSLEVYAVWISSSRLRARDSA